MGMDKNSMAFFLRQCRLKGLRRIDPQASETSRRVFGFFLLLLHLVQIKIDFFHFKGFLKTRIKNFFQGWLRSHTSDSVSAVW